MSADGLPAEYEEVDVKMKRVEDKKQVTIREDSLSYRKRLTCLHGSDCPISQAPSFRLMYVSQLAATMIACRLAA